MALMIWGFKSANLSNPSVSHKFHKFKKSEQKYLMQANIYSMLTRSFLYLNKCKHSYGAVIVYVCNEFKGCLKLDTITIFNCE